MHTGSCLCGAVSFNVSTELQPPDACHCTTCRKWSGHFLSRLILSQARLICLERIRLRGINHPKRFGGGFVPFAGARCFLIHFFMIGPRSRWALSTPRPGRLLAGIFSCLKRQIIIRLKMGFHKIKPKLQRNWLREILRHAVLLQIFSVYLV